METSTNFSNPASFLSDNILPIRNGNRFRDPLSEGRNRDNILPIRNGNRFNSYIDIEQQGDNILPIRNGNIAKFPGFFLF